MYRVANAVTPEALEAIATHLFVEMLERGYTSVCEFHYLHNDRDGRPYADPATLADRRRAGRQRAPASASRCCRCSISRAGSAGRRRTTASGGS